MGELNHLVVYMSNSCNLACDYCYVAVNQGPAVRLDFEEISRAIDDFCLRVASGRMVSFLGGEPLLDWALLAKSLMYARARCGPGAALQAFTNGTLLTAEKIEVFKQAGARCTVSLDGGRPENDAHRVYARDAARSVYDDVLERLRGLDKAPIGVNMVFTADTVDRLLVNVDEFFQAGFGRVNFNPAVYGEWDESRIEVLRRVMSGLARWHRLLLDSGVRPPHISAVDSILSVRNFEGPGRWWHQCHNMVLGPDARYYACDKALSFPAGSAESLGVGGASSGLDWGARERKLEELAARVEIERDGAEDMFCPMGVVAHARLAGRDPRSALAGFRAVSRVFAQGLAELIDASSGHPIFNEMYAGASRTSEFAA